MKSKSQRHLWIPAFLTLLGAAPAYAEDFTITVPIRVSNLPPSIEAALIYCAVSSTNRATRDIGLGHASPRVEIRSGAFSGSATVRFNAAPGQDPGRATHYECGVSSFVGRNERGETVHYFSDGGRNPFPLAAGASLVLNTGVQPLP